MTEEAKPHQSVTFYGGTRPRPPRVASDKPAMENLARSMVVYIVPPLTFTLIGALFAFAQFRQPRLPYFALLSILFYGFLQVGKHAYDDTPKGRQGRDFGSIIIFLAALGVVTGCCIYHTLMFPAEAIWNGEAYHNVVASELAAAHSDAVQIYFNKESRIALAGTIEYQARGSSVKRCLAPILQIDQTEAIQYWAVGINCCANGLFKCGDSETATGGYVALQADEWKEAAKFAAATNKRPTAEEALFVHYSDDASGVVRSWVQQAVAIFVVIDILAIFVTSVHTYRAEKTRHAGSISLISHDSPA